MFSKKEFPILEFDPDEHAIIEPQKDATKAEVPERCVITFFGDVMQGLLQAGKLKQISSFATASVELPVYETLYNGEKMGIVQGYVGAPGAAAELEELIASGFSKFIVCGAAGVLQKGIQVGHLIVPDCAVRDEGTSYHYAKPSREIECDPYALNVIEKYLTEQKLPYIRAKMWTTDAFYRETREKMAQRAAEGCVTVEMEAAAFFAVAQFRRVRLGQILFGGDDLSGVEWDSRRWVSREQIRKGLTELSMSVCRQL